jgi:hypothetical protein
VVHRRWWTFTATSRPSTRRTPATQPTDASKHSPLAMGAPRCVAHQSSTVAAMAAGSSVPKTARSTTETPHRSIVDATSSASDTGDVDDMGATVRQRAREAA